LVSVGYSEWNEPLSEEITKSISEEVTGEASVHVTDHVTGEANEYVMEEFRRVVIAFGYSGGADFFYLRQYLYITCSCGK